MLEEYQRLVLMRNKTQNLFSPKDIKMFWHRHIEDSFKAESFLPDEGCVIDIGSGGGIPGIPLAIAHRDLRFFLIERRTRKADFLSEVVEHLNLKNVSVVPRNFSEINDLRGDIFLSRGVKLDENILKHAAKLSAKGIYIYFRGENFERKKYKFLINYVLEIAPGLLLIHL